MGYERYWMAVLVALCSMGMTEARAQTLEVSLSFTTGSPLRMTLTPTPVPLGAFRFRAVGTDVHLNGLVLTGLGTGDFAADLRPNVGIQAWLDDGDGRFEEQTDQLLAASSGATPQMALLFSNSINVGQGLPPENMVHVWIVVHVAGFIGPGDDRERTYSVSIAQAGDVISDATSVVFGPTMPITPPITIIGGPVDESNSITCVASQDENVDWSVVVVVFALIVTRWHRRRYVARNLAAAFTQCLR